jgi:hypothetical protein
VATEEPDAVPAAVQAVLREELQALDEEVDGLRRTAERLRAQIGGRSDGVVDPEDMASALASAEEQEALIGVLSERRAEVSRRLTNQ